LVFNAMYGGGEGTHFSIVTNGADYILSLIKH